MKSSKRSALETYLQRASEDGTHQSDGEFTIDISRALDKLSKFQLPSDTAWILKLVQTGVALGAESIRVNLTKTLPQILFLGDIQIRLDEVEEAIVSVNPKSRALQHLSIALRDVGFRQERPFWLSLPNGDCLVWDGASLCRETQRAKGEMSIEVRPLKSETSMWTGISKINAELLKTLVQQAHSCPIPLTCDGRRLDALEQNPEHGWGENSQPVMYAAVEGDLADFPIPPFTRRSKSKQRVHEELALANSPENLWEDQPDQAALAFIVSAHIHWKKAGKSSRWIKKDSMSRIYWVDDGVVIDTEEIGTRAICSVGVFASADGLQTDLGGFKLKDSGDRSKRVTKIREMLKEPLKSAEEWSCEEGLKAADGKMRGFGAIFIAGGTLSGLMSFAKPPLILHSAAFLATGISAWRSGDSKFRELVSEIEEMLAKLPGTF